MMASTPGISAKMLASFQEEFESDPRYRLAQNVCTRHSLIDVLRTRKAEEDVSHVYTNKLESEAKPVTNQKASGRCWIFACLNCMRLPFMKALNLEEFEFSQNYLFCLDKLERFNYLMHVFVEAARRGEPADGRLVAHLNSNPSEDGGQWGMLVNLIEKYGVIPKKCFPEPQTALESRRLGMITNGKMREYCMRLRTLVQKGATEDEINTNIKIMTGEIYRIISVSLGTPPKTFTWEYYDKNKEYKKIGPITPMEFYKQHVKPVYNMEDKVVLVHDPRPSNPYHKLYTVEFLGNMVGGKDTLYNNQPVDVLKKMAAESIKNDEAVWFGSDVFQFLSWKKLGMLDVNLYDYDLVFGTTVTKLNKADRLLYGDTFMNHAMVLTAFSQEGDKYTKWRIENSWGDDAGDKGYVMMTDDWFSEYVFEVVVDKKYLPSDVQDVLKQEPKVLPAWDPMGHLA